MMSWENGCHGKEPLVAAPGHDLTVLDSKDRRLGGLQGYPLRAVQDILGSCEVDMLWPVIFLVRHPLHKRYGFTFDFHRLAIKVFGNVII